MQEKLLIKVKFLKWFYFVLKLMLNLVFIFYKEENIMLLMFLEKITFLNGFIHIELDLKMITMLLFLEIYHHQFKCKP